MFAARVKRTLRVSDERYLQIEILIRTIDRPIQKLFDQVHHVLDQVKEQSQYLGLAEMSEQIQSGLYIAFEEVDCVRIHTEWIKVIEESTHTVHATSNEVCFIVPLPIPEESAVPSRSETPE